MPGRLVMETDVNDPVAAGQLKRGGNHLSQTSDGPDQKRLAFGDDRPNGAKAMLAPNGVNGSVHSSDPSGALVKVEQGTDGGPPEIEQYRDTLIPFGRMLERMAQQTYFDLTEMMEALADMQVQTQPQMANGVGSQSAPDKSAVSVDKKLRILNFGQTHKDRYIKALVLSDWARNMDDMAKLIDVSMCLRKHDWATTAAADSIYRLKENMVGAKMPNPNIEGALELLSSGQAVWMPDMGVYIPPKPLAASELLDTLADMNFALSIRLNLHENIPKQMSNFSIGNGRATFKVQDEFEVELAIADPDPESPLYFIDLRLTFNPPVTINQDRLRNQLTDQVNTVLASAGLVGCYDFLHDFVLTHKLNILRCQALELARGKWIDNIEVQYIHRAVIVQYWTDLPGGKNWIELGIASGRSDAASEDTGAAAKPSRLSCRWFRRGKETTDHHLNFDFSDLSVEKLLDQVIARHAEGRLNAIHDGLAELSNGTTTFTQELKTSQDTATECWLTLIAKPLTSALTIMIDPVRGTYFASPSDNDTSDIERRLNADDQADVPVLLRNHLCRNVVQRITEQAQSLALTRVAVDVQPSTTSPFPAQVVAHASFRLPSAGSDVSQETPIRAQFLLTVTSDLVAGVSWFISETNTSGDGGLYIRSAVPLSVPELAGKIDRESLSAISLRAAKVASASALSRELSSSKTAFVSKPADSSTDVSGTTVLKPSDLVPGLPDASIFSDVGSLILQSAKGVTYLFRTWLQKKKPSVMEQLCQSLSTETDMILAADGQLSLTVQEPVLTQLQDRLGSVARLYGLLEVTERDRVRLIHASLAEIKFAYGKDLTCTVNLRADHGALLEFGVTDDRPDGAVNPHEPIKRQFEDSFVTRGGQANAFTVEKFKSLCAILEGTLPIVERMQKVEEAKPASHVLLTCHSATVFNLAYKAPFPEITIQVAAQSQRGRVLWVARLAQVKVLGDAARQGLSQLWRDKGRGWHGAKIALIASVEGLGEVLERIHTLMLQNQGPADTAGRRESTTVEPSGRTANEAVVLD